MKFEKKSNKIIYFELVFSFIFISVMILIFSIAFVSIYMNSLRISKNAEATSVVTNVIENMRKRTFKEFESYIDGLSIVGISKQIENEIQIISVNGMECQEKFFGTDIPSSYNLMLEISNTDNNFNLAKNVNITISYSILKNRYSLEMETLIEREKIDRVNVPIISNEYFNLFDISLEEYDIIPIKYSATTNSYVETNTGDPDWYNYASKEWAKVLVTPKKIEFNKDNIIDFNGNVLNTFNLNGEQIDINRFIYTWIPNFSVKDNETFFRYAARKKCNKTTIFR